MIGESLVLDPDQRILVPYALLAVVLLICFWRARVASRWLQQFVDESGEIEARGRRPSVLLRALSRTVAAWWRSSAGLVEAIIAVVVFGYLMPSLVLVTLLQVEGVSLERAVMVAIFHQADAATLGAVSWFEWLESVATPNLSDKGRAMSFFCASITTVAGSIFMAKVLFSWIGNLFNRIGHKFDQWAKKRLAEGASAPQPVSTTH